MYVTELLDCAKHFEALWVFDALNPPGEGLRELVVERDILKGETLFWRNRLVDALPYKSVGWRERDICGREGKKGFEGVCVV